MSAADPPRHSSADAATLPPSTPPAEVTLDHAPSSPDAATLPPSEPAGIGSIPEHVAIPGYEIERELGRGGMGVV
jgi:hypothetical protein